MFTTSEQLMLLLILLIQTVEGSETSQLFHLNFEMSLDDLQFEIILSRSTRVTATNRIYNFLSSTLKQASRLNRLENKLSLVNAGKYRKYL